jgi:predicted YcjX-like family ATPase
LLQCLSRWIQSQRKLGFKRGAQDTRLNDWVQCFTKYLHHTHETSTKLFYLFLTRNFTLLSHFSSNLPTLHYGLLHSKPRFTDTSVAVLSEDYSVPAEFFCVSSDE